MLSSSTGHSFIRSLNSWDFARVIRFSSLSSDPEPPDFGGVFSLQFNFRALLVCPLAVTNDCENRDKESQEQAHKYVPKQGLRCSEESNLCWRSKISVPQSCPGH